MTALTTAGALLTILLSGNVAGYEILHPMVVVIMGGLVTSTLLNLFVTPTLYLRFGPTTIPKSAEEMGKLALDLPGKGD